MLNVELFENRLDRARETSQDPETLGIIASTLRNWNDRGDLLALNRINPWRVANENGLRLEQVAPEFIRGVKSQLFSLHWEVHCPHCNGIVNEYADLAEATEHSNCDMCAVDFPADFNERVEVSFSLAKDILSLHLPPVCEVNPALCTQAKPGLWTGRSRRANIGSFVRLHVLMEPCPSPAKRRMRFKRRRLFSSPIVFTSPR
jgi:adenylate cyclase